MIENNGRKVKLDDGSPKPKENVNVRVKRTHIELFERLTQVPPAAVETLNGALLVLTTPRSGSTMFCEALNSANILGLCEEWFNYEYFAAWLTVTGGEVFNLKEYITWVAQRTAKNKVFALKWHVGQVDVMQRDFGVGLRSMGFKHTIWLYRRDKIAQAISLARAVKTNKFRSYEDDLCKPDDVCCAEITGSLATLESQYRYYDSDLHTLADVEIAYEDVCDFNSPTYRETFEKFGFNLNTPLTTRVEKQRDSKSSEAAAEYRKHLLSLVNGSKQ